LHLRALLLQARALGDKLVTPKGVLRLATCKASATRGAL
jgi:hypothetical protein